MLIQAYAWCGMLIEYSQTDGIAQAAKDTFSGEKPCELCVKISVSEKDDVTKKVPLQSEKSAGGLKACGEMLVSKMISGLFQQIGHKIPFLPFYCVKLKHEDFSASPPTPPPRFVA